MPTEIQVPGGNLGAHGILGAQNRYPSPYGNSGAHGIRSVPGTGYPSPSTCRRMQSPLPPLLVLRGALFINLWSAPKTGFLSTRGFPGWLGRWKFGGESLGWRGAEVRRGSERESRGGPGPVPGACVEGYPSPFKTLT